LPMVDFRLPIERIEDQQSTIDHREFRQSGGT